MLTVIVSILPIASLGVGPSIGFMPAMLALVVAFNLISAVLLLNQFYDTGERRSIVMALAYVTALGVIAGFAAAFPGVLGRVGPLGNWPSTAPWLWTAWHSAFLVMVTASLAPWPAHWEKPVKESRRASVITRTVSLALAASGLIVLIATTGSGWLPALIEGTDSSALTRVTSPVMLPLAAIATLVCVVGAIRIRGALRWGALATAAASGDTVLTLVSEQRFSLGWYVGRSMGVVSAGVVLVAMLLEFSRLRRQLAIEAHRLQLLLERSGELEELQSTLLDLMSDGVVLRGAAGQVLAHNRMAEHMLGLSREELYGRELVPPSRRVIRSDGSPWDDGSSPEAVTLRTGVPQQDRIVGVPVPEGPTRWLRVNTALTNGEAGAVRYVVSTMADESDQHAAELVRRDAAETTRRRIQAVLDDGGPRIVLQPIVDLLTGTAVGCEALARFDGEPPRPPDAWFAEAAVVGLGTDLELAAVREALALQPFIPRDQYLSVNVSPATAASAGLLALLTASGIEPRGLVLELTEHSDVQDYDVLRSALAGLRTQGVRIAVDDAGAGYASLSHILHLRPDIVKLDCALVRGIDADPARRALASALALFALNIGASLVAEGIENEADLTALREVGVTHGQGYLLGRPAAASGHLLAARDGSRGSHVGRPRAADTLSRHRFLR